MSDKIDEFLRSEDTVSMMAAIFREIGISPPPHNINTGKVLSRIVLTSLASLRKVNVVSEDSATSSEEAVSVREVQGSDSARN